MTAPGENLLAWLDTAISAREEMAKAAPPAPWVTVPDEDTVLANDGIPVAEVFALSGGQTRAALAHIAANDPRSVLRQCAFERTLLKLHGGNMHSCPATDETDYLDEWTHFGFDDVCPVVHGLASSYGRTAAQTPPTDGDQVT